MSTNPAGPASAPWFESAADLLAEGDPGATPFLVNELIVERSIAAVVGAPKGGKTWVLLDLAIAIAAGERALGRFDVPTAGPVLLILEESGRAALHRRLRKLIGGRAMQPEQLVALFFAANKRVRLDDVEWQQRLLDAAGSREWRLIAFDPLARIKGAVDENVQREIGPVLDFLRDLREVSGATVGYVHHTPHDRTRHRGSSDLEAYWETKLTIAKDEKGRTLQAEHREAEGVGPFRLSFGFNATTSTLRLRVADDELVEQVRRYLLRFPTASANQVSEDVKGNRQRVLAIVRELRGGGSDTSELPGTAEAGSDGGGGSAAEAPPVGGPLRNHPADFDAKPVVASRNHPPDNDAGEARQEGGRP